MSQSQGYYQKLDHKTSHYGHDDRTFDTANGRSTYRGRRGRGNKSYR